MLALEWEDFEVVSDKSVGKDGLSFDFELFKVEVARGEVRQDEFFSIGFFGDGGRLLGGEMKVFIGEVSMGFKIGAFAQKKLDIACDVDSILAVARVDDDCNAVASTYPADIVELDDIVIDVDVAVRLQGAHKGPSDTIFLERFLVEFACISFGDSPGDVVDAVIEEGSFDFKLAIVFDQTLAGDGMFNHMDIFVIDCAIAQPVKVFFAAGRVVAMDGVGDLVQVEAHEHGAKAEAMISMEVGDEDVRHNSRSYICKDKLPLGAFPRIKEEAFIVPAKEVSSVIAFSGGLLA